MSSVDWPDVDGLVLEIARRFKEHDMREHLRLLREFYRERRRAKSAACRGADPAPWDVGMLLVWAAIWRIPPFDGVYPLRPRRSACTCKADSRSSLYTHATFPAGALVACHACGSRWMELDED